MRDWIVELELVIRGGWMPVSAPRTRLFAWLKARRMGRHHQVSARIRRPARRGEPSDVELGNMDPSLRPYYPKRQVNVWPKASRRLP